MKLTLSTLLTHVLVLLLASLMLTVPVSAATPQDMGLSFDGVSGYGQAVGGAPIQNSTWEAWVRLPQYSPYPGHHGWVLAWWGSWTATPFAANTDGSLNVDGGYGTPGSGQVLPPGGLSEGNWHHIATTFGNESSPSLICYVDGQEVGRRGSGSQSPTSGIATCLGAYNYQGWKGFFKGEITEARISTTRRYSGPFEPEREFQPDSSTWGLWHFDEGSGSTAHDEMGRADFSLNGGYSWVNVGISLGVTNLVAGNVCNISLSNAEPSANCIVAYSFHGNGPTQTPFGLLDLAQPIRTLPAVTADGYGDASLNVNIPLRMHGWNVWVQAVSPQGPMASNSLATVIG